MPSKQNSRSNYRAETVTHLLGNEDLDSLGLLRTRPTTFGSTTSRPSTNIAPLATQLRER